MEKAILKATKRTEIKKNAIKQLRVNGLIPCVVYGDKKDPTTVTVDSIAFEKALRTPYKRNTILKLDIDDNGKTATEYVISYDIQRHVLTQYVTHIDFLRVVEGKEIKITVPLVFEGVAPGTKRGGTLIKKMDSVVITTLPKNIPNKIVVDVSNLNVGEHISVSDLAQGDFTILSTPSNSVVRIAAPRVEQESTDDAEAPAADSSAAEQSNGDAESK
tara:strand:- start:27 stop:677 length:651 start_codon:yes stop_codon:yes gene_type:complete